MSPILQRDLYRLCGKMWKKVRVRLYKVKLSRHEWEDIQMIATARVFRHIYRYDSSRGRLAGWVFVIMYRAAKNELRAILPDPRNPAHVWRTDILRARTLAVKVKQTGRWGEEVTVVEPDIMDPSSTRDPVEIAEFVGGLSPKHREVWRLVHGGTNMSGLQRRLKLSCYRQAQQLIRELSAKWKSYSSGAGAACPGTAL